MKLSELIAELQKHQVPSSGPEVIASDELGDFEIESVDSAEGPKSRLVLLTIFAH